MASFQELFAGSGRTHGRWTQEFGSHTIEGPATDQDYQDHLTGTKGLGLVPVREDGTCVFGALDIDVDTIDHRALYHKIKARNLPLNVCRSKSGAAHLYVFFDKPYNAATVRTLLKKWAGLLGYPKCEVFPKQDKIDDKNLGNWLNLPYYGGDRSLRYCLGPDAPYTLQEFLDNVIYYDPNVKINSESEPLSGELVQIMPPCLSQLTMSGLPAGVRNQGMFNFGVFFRKSHPNGWEDRLREHNQKHVQPPLDDKELAQVIKSLNKTKYQYTCKQEPICSRCVRSECVTLPYGVNHMPWQEGGTFDEFTIARLRKVDTRPPRYRVQINTKDIEMGTDELRNYQTGFKKKVFEELNLVLPPMKQEYWDQQLRELFTTLEIIEAPADASINGMILLKIYEFCTLSERARKIEDVLKGIPFRQNGHVMFRSLDLQRYLQSARFSVESQILYQLMLSEGGSYQELHIKGKKTMVWSVPMLPGAVQTESFEEPKFDKIGEDL